MAFKTFAPGVLTSSDVNTFLMRQAVITCTSSTRPASPSEGMTIYETDTNEYRIYNGSAWDCFYKPWTSYSPFLFGTGWSFGTTTLTGEYARYGRSCEARIKIEWNNDATPGAGALYVSLPITANVSDKNVFDGPAGHLAMYDDSAGKCYGGTFSELGSTAGTTLAFVAPYFQFGDEIINNNVSSGAISGGQFVPTDVSDIWLMSIIYGVND